MIGEVRVATNGSYLVAEGCSALESDLFYVKCCPLVTPMNGTYASTTLQASQIQSCTSRHSHVLDDDSRARGLALNRSRSIGECAACASIELSWGSRCDAYPFVACTT